MLAGSVLPDELYRAQERGQMGLKERRGFRPVRQGLGDREDVDKGKRVEKRSTVLASLDPEWSNIWICERLINRDGSTPTQMPLGIDLPRLDIP